MSLVIPSYWSEGERERERDIVREVSSFQRLKCMQEWYLGREKVSCLERCPQFKISVLVYIDVHVQCEWK